MFENYPKFLIQIGDLNFSTLFYWVKKWDEMRYFCWFLTTVFTQVVLEIFALEFSNVLRLLRLLVAFELGKIVWLTR